MSVPKTEAEEIAELDDSFFNLSDAEIMAMNQAPDPEAVSENTHMEDTDIVSAVEEPVVPEADPVEPEVPPVVTEAVAKPPTETSVDVEDPVPAVVDKAPAAGTAEGGEVNPAEGDGAETDAAKPPKEEEVTQIDWSTIAKPFKAGKTEISVKNPAEAIALMEKGADYHRKMTEMKPHLKTVRMLENAGITPEKLNLLMDIHNGDVEAVKKLLLEKQIDPVDIDQETPNTYEASNYSVSDAEVELGQINDDLRTNSPNYDRLLNVVGSEWDQASRDSIREKPSDLIVLDGHMKTGVYDIIHSELVKAKALGQLPGLSDLEAYEQIGEAIHTKGGFNHLFPATSTPAPSGDGTPPLANPSPSRQAEDPKLVEKRKAASASPTAPATGNKVSDTNPLSMSDDDFLKQA